MEKLAEDQDSWTLPPPETSELLAFVRAAETGSISAAARELGTPRATVSRRLERLEERLAVRLMQRTTRRLQLTDAGEELFDRARSALDAATRAGESVRRRDDVPRGLLRVSVPTGRGPLEDVTHEYIERYPEVQLEIIQSSAHEDLLAKNIDVALRAGMSMDPGLTMRKLQSTELIAVASPAYLQGAPRLRALGDLVQHRCLVSFERGHTPATHWPTCDGGRVRVRGHLAANDAVFLRRCTLRGNGIAMLPRIIVEEELYQKQLVRVLPRKLGAKMFLALVYPERQLMKPAARAFIDMVVDRVSAQASGKSAMSSRTPTRRR